MDVPEQTAKRERTLLLSLLLSMWAPLVTGIAVFTSRSSTQLADFIRRTIELVALFISWSVYRHLSRRDFSPKRREQYQRLAAMGVAIALACSAVAMFAVAIARLRGSYQPGGNVYLGLFVVLLGAITNGWFWRRYTALNQGRDDKIIGAQGHLYRAKTFVDLCVLVALLAVAFFSTSPVTRYVDLAGTFLVASYLLWSSVQSAHTTLSVKASVAE